MEDAMANMKLIDDEEEEIQEIVGVETFAYQFYLVGRCLTDSVVHFPSLRNTMADLWHPIGGISITDLGEKRFKYEKLSLLCFICGRLGHGESFCPLRLQIEPSNITFGWDLSLRVATRRRNVMDSRWLRTADGIPCNLDNLGNFNQGNLSYEGNVLGRNVRGGIGSQNINPNLRQAGSGKYKESSSYNLGYGGGDVRMVAVGAGYGTMDLLSNEEEDPIALVEALETRAVELNENPKLERSWVGETTICEKAPE
ncbi:hypothetical protein Goarm_012076 [Gossypium armourianum]|uniref:Zinc knuckle CX2CX4HX4C domain-containing protein n=1 Tax=Gossypium armourianum TaxID=34283 RepID=A0A7J9IYV0_9ROSI|nr:hypothetical protein [Gossypium armourianum]